MHLPSIAAALCALSLHLTVAHAGYVPRALHTSLHAARDGSAQYGSLATRAKIQVTPEVYARPRFKTEPSFVPTYFIVENITDDQSLLAPGYLFITPVHGGPTIGIFGDSVGPEIREMDGTLVWYGSAVDTYGPEPRARQRLQDFHLCTHLGVHGRHLCWSEKAKGEDRKHVVIDDGYNLVSTLRTGLDQDISNMHEFNVVDNGYTYLHTVWALRKQDLRHYGGPAKGVMMDGCIQDISMQSDTSTFDWCWTDHFPIWESSLFPANGPNTTNITSTKAGTGAPRDAWDPLHLNSIDKNFEGDYLVSVRHADQVFLLAGNDNVHGVEPGTALWRFGGRGNQISVDGEPFKFTKQHHARFISTTKNEIVFTLLDNAWQGDLAPSDTTSSGMVVALNNETMTARLLRRYRSPTGHVCPSQGNMDILPNENVFIGWGSCAEVSEFTSDGKLLYHMHFTNETYPGEEEGFTFSYRVRKNPWVGKPAWKPKMLAYSYTCVPGTAETGPLRAWVSWNGATEVRSWRFTVANSRAGPWIPAGTWAKDGFETEVILTAPSLARWLTSVMFPRYVSVEALDERGNVLENGVQISKVFVPGDDVREQCNSTICPAEVDMFNEELSQAALCALQRSSILPQLLGLAIVVLIVEYLDYSYVGLLPALLSKIPGIFSSRRESARADWEGREERDMESTSLIQTPTDANGGSEKVADSSGAPDYAAPDYGAPDHRTSASFERDEPGQ